MNNQFNAKEFLDNLSPEMRNRIRSCKSAEEVGQVLKENHLLPDAVELSEDQLDAITGGRGIMPIAMAAMMLFSSMAPLSTYAADTLKKPAYTDVQRPEAETEAKAEDANKDAAEDANKDAAEDVNKDAAEDANKDAAEDANKDAAEDANKDAAEDANKDAAEDANKDAAEDANKDAAEDANKDATQDATEATTEDNSSYIDKLNEKREKAAEEKAKQKQAEKEKKEKQKEEEAKQRKAEIDASIKEREKDLKEQAEKDAELNAKLSDEYAKDMQKKLDEKDQLLSKLSAEEKKQLSKENDLIESYIRHCGNADPQTVISNVKATEAVSVSKSEVVQKGDDIVIKRTYTKDDSRDDDLHPIFKTSTVQLGQIIKVDDGLKNCNPSSISLNRNLMDLTVDPNSVKLKGGEMPTVKVDPNGRGSVNNGMKILLDKINNGNIESAANVVCRMTTLDSADQYNAAISARQKFYGDVQVDVAADYFKEKQVVMLELDQIYYTLSVNRRADEPVFASNVTFEDVRKACTGTEEKSQRQVYWDACDKIEREISILEAQIESVPKTDKERINNMEKDLLDRKDALLKLKLQGCPEISVKDEPKGAPLAMITDVHYGRRIICFIETNDKSFDLQAELAAAGFQKKFTGDVKFAMNSKLASCTAHYSLLGGSNDGAKNIMKTSCDLSELLTVINQDTKLAVGTAYQMGYTARYLDGNSIACVNVTNVHNVTEEHVKKATKLKVHNDHITKWNKWNGVVITGKKIIGYDGKDYILGDEVKIADTKFYKDGIVAGKYFSIPGNIDLNTVKVVFDAEGADFKTEGSDCIFLKDLVGPNTDANIINYVDVCTSSRLDHIGFTWHVESSVKIHYPSGSKTRYVQKFVADDVQLDNDYLEGYVS
jgi:hypothetical protein